MNRKISVSEENILVYEKALTGQSRFIDKKIFSSSAEGNNMIAASIVRYAIRTYLYTWSPEEVVKYMDKKVKHMLHLDDLIPYIIFPPELEKGSSLYLAYLAYPESIHLHKEDMVVEVFERVVNGKNVRLPRGYFDGQDGRERLYICLRYYISTRMWFRDIRDIYARFASSEINEILKECKMSKAYKEYFDTPVEFLHEVLPEEEKDEFYYHVYELHLLLKKGAGRKQRTVSGSSEVALSENQRTDI